MLKLSFGADPEVFVKQGGKFVSAHGLVQGTKENPFKVERGAVQVDGMALEFNIDPASTEEEFALNVETVIATLGSMVPDYELVAQPTAHFGKAYMKTQPKEALELGCDPDYNAYTGSENSRPDGDVDFRTGAGHLHIGWTSGVDINNADHREACNTVAKQLDWSLGILSTMFDKDEKRRELYGNWGALRYKPYGMEYRTLSNAWLNDPKLIRWVFRVAEQAIRNLENKKHLYIENSPESLFKAGKADLLYKYVVEKQGYEAPPV